MEFVVKGTDYRIVEGKEINSGGFNKIYECTLVGDRGEIIKENLVLKRLIHDLDFNQAWRFDREMKYLEKLNHENILRPFYCDYDEGFIIMERFPMNLEDFIRSSGYTRNEYLSIFYDILSGVQYYIGEGVIHRDLKPQNILIDEEKRVKIADFGLSSRIVREDTVQLTKATYVGGTHFFSSPEQLEGLTSADERSDLYSLGKILYVLATEDLTYHEVKYEKIDPQLRLIVKKATKYNPDERYQNIDDFLKSFKMVFKKENHTSFKEYQLDNIIQIIKSEIHKEEVSESLQSLFEHITNPEYSDVVDLMVKLDVETHVAMWKIDSDSYSDFMKIACNAISEQRFIYSFVDDIVSSAVSIIDELTTIMDIELQGHIIFSAVSVSTAHNRYWGMERIARYISEIEDDVLIDNLKNGDNKLNARDVKKISQYHRSEKLNSFLDEEDSDLIF